MPESAKSGPLPSAVIARYTPRGPVPLRGTPWLRSDNVRENHDFLHAGHKGRLRARNAHRQQRPDHGDRRHGRTCSGAFFIDLLAPLALREAPLPAGLGLMVSTA